jgi:hypothetical protein
VYFLQTKIKHPYVASFFPSRLVTPNHGKSNLIAPNPTFSRKKRLFIFMRRERLKKFCGRAAARDFGVLARLSEGSRSAGPPRPVTACLAKLQRRRKRKQSQNPKVPLLFSQPHGHRIFDNALTPNQPKSTLDHRACVLDCGGTRSTMPLCPPPFQRHSKAFKGIQSYSKHF